MLESVSDLAIGVAGTVCYLYLWSRALAPKGDLEGEPCAKSEVQVRRRWRWRSLQTLFFLGLTPYILFLFFLMDRARAFLGENDMPLQP